MSVVWVPYHLDEHLPDLDLVFRPTQVITVGMSGSVVWGRLGVLYAAVAHAVARVVAGPAGRRGSRPVVVSGDCTTALGTVAGLQNVGLDPGIVWFDAHGDVQTLETTASGYLGGLSLRFLVGYRPELIAARLGLRAVAENRVVLVGARDLDPPEVSYLDGAAIRRSTVTGLTAADLPDGPLYVHVDLDVVDPAEIPGLRYPAPGGPGPAEIAGALQMLLSTGRVAALGVACTWHPGHAAAARVGPWLEAAVPIARA